MIRLPWSGRRGSAGGEGPEGRARPAAGAPVHGLIRGERGHSVASRVRSLQSRLNGVLAAALAIGVGVAMLTWYYAEALHRPGRSAGTAAASLVAEARMRLPPLGPIVFPRAAHAVHAALGAPQPAAVQALMPLLPAQPALLPRAPIGGTCAAGLRRGPHRALARRLSGAVFAAAGTGAGGSMGGSPAAGMTGGRPAGSAYPGFAVRPNGEVSGRETLGTLLRPTVLRATRAQLLPEQRLLLPKGAFIDCTLETAIDSTLPGMTSCITATDTFSADGTVVLLERGTQLIGETRGQVRQGMARVFVIWTEARTPSGVLVRLDSPGTDALGRSGLTGTVNRHFWQRFGAALLVSTIDAGVQSSLESGSRTVVIDPMASEDVMTEALRGTVDIPPTITVPNGARIQVLVARDVDFRSVYELVPRS